MVIPTAIGQTESSGDLHTMKCQECGCRNPDDASLCVRCNRMLTGGDTLDGLATEPGEPVANVLGGRYRIIRQLGAGGMGVV